MKLSTKGRYAVMAIADLARYGGSVPVSLADIADRQEISLSYLEQLFAKMRRSGVVNSVRGPGGGYLLARPPEALRIIDVILAVDEPIKATGCKEGSGRACTGAKGHCITHELWDELGRHIHMYLSSVTVADVVNKRVGDNGSALAAATEALTHEAEAVFSS